MTLALWAVWIAVFPFIGPTTLQETTDRIVRVRIPARQYPSDFVESFERLTATADWRLVGETRLKFATHHPQGLLKIGEHFLLSSVETSPDSTGESTADPGRRSGVGHLFLFGSDGELIQDLILGEGACFHPGGIDFDGRFVWVPVAQYRPDSTTIIYRLDLGDMRLQQAFRVNDHIGGLAVDAERDRLYGVSWGSRKFYTWDLRGRQISKQWNPSRYIDYQDCKSVGLGRAICSGLKSFRGPDGRRFALGGLDCVDLDSGVPLAQQPVTLYTEDGIVMTQNPFDFELQNDSVTFYFVPEDDDSVLYQWRVPWTMPAALDLR